LEFFAVKGGYADGVVAAVFEPFKAGVDYWGCGAVFLDASENSAHKPNFSIELHFIVAV
jgi:hypothetical protein